MSPSAWLALIPSLCVGVACGEGRASRDAWCDRPLRTGYQGLERISVADPWFHVYRLGSGVYAIYEPHQFQEIISYLIVGSTHALLFDTGMGMGQLRETVEELTDLPVVVLNSHTHYDHIGANADFPRILGLDTEFTRSNARGVPHDVVSGEVTRESICLTHVPDLDTATYAIRPFRISEYVENGSMIDLGDRSIEVLSIPGHTPDALAVLDREAGLLWTGDTFYEGPIWLFFPGTDLEAYARTIQRLALLAPEVRRVHPGHNTAVANPDRLVQLEKAYTAVRSGGHPFEARDGGLVEYVFDGFSFLMKAPP